MTSPIVLMHFDEPEGVNPSDSLGNLENMFTEPGIVAPVVVATWTGVGRRFLQASTSGLVAGDISANGTMLPRDATIQVLIAPILTGASGPQTIIARGINDGSTPERYAYGLEIEEQAGNPGYFEIRWFWQDGAGTIITAPPGVFKHAGDGVEVMLTATRRWEGSTRVVVRYYIDRRMIAELVTTDGTISGGVTGSTSIGARKAGGTWGRFLNATIDELLVTDYEMSADEIAQTFDRLTVHQPAGSAMFQGLAPPGATWFDNPSNGIGRRAKVVGQGLGLALSTVSELRSVFLPDKAPAWLVARWERLYALAAKPLDSLDVRRARVLARMAADEGYSIPALQASFATLFNLEAEEVEILEFANEIRDSFATLEAERWSQGTIGTWDIAAPGELRITVTSGTPVPVNVTPNPCHVWTPIDRDKIATFFVHAYAQGKIADYAGLPSGAFVGMFLHARIGSRTFWFGVFNNPATATNQLGYCELNLAGYIIAFTALATIAAGPIWLRIKVAPAVGIFSGPTDAITLSWSTIGPSTGFASATVNASPVYDLVGFGVHTVATPGVDIVARFDDFVLWTPESLRPFAWFAYRDPALAGSYDLIGACALARKVSPAHMYAAACASKSLICGDPIFGQVGYVPMGADL